MKPISLTMATPATTPQRQRERLKEAAHKLEAVFIGQLFQAMRASVPRAEGAGGSTGEDMFTAMLDERLANEVSLKLQHGMGEALYRQISRRLPEDQKAAPAALPRDVDPNGTTRRIRVP